MIDTSRIIEDFINNSDSKYRNNVIKLGIPEENSLGVPTSYIRKYARNFEKSNKLSLTLWNSGYHELKILALLVSKPREFNIQEINSFLDEIFSWDLCDMFCKELVAKSSFSRECIYSWINSNSLFTKRASIVTMCSNVTKDKICNEEELDIYIQLCIEQAETNELYIRKAISWTLKEIGKYNHNSQKKILFLCNEYLESESKSTRWIMNDVKKEVENLVQAPGRRRLISRNSKMGMKGN